MKLRHIPLLVLLVVSSNLLAQYKGNYNDQDFQISRQNILTSGNANAYNPIVQQQMHRPLTPSNVLSIDLKVLQNVTAATYTAIFNVCQIGETSEEANKLVKERIHNIKQKLKVQGLLQDDIMVDVISFVPVYEIEVEKKLFSKTYTEVPKGFELQQNIHIRFNNTNQFEDILTACAENEIYNLVKVDYFIENIADVYKNLQTEILKLVEDEKEYYTTLGFDFSNYNVAVADDKYCYFPKDFYRSYQAFNSVSFEAIKKTKGITSVKKQTSYYYQPLTYEDYDLVINPSILEPVTQVGMSLKLQFTPKPKEEQKTVTKTELVHKYYVVSPNGTIDVKELNTNK